MILFFILLSDTLETYDSMLIDHDEFEWVVPERLLEWCLAPADIPLAKKIGEIRRIRNVVKWQ